MGADAYYADSVAACSYLCCYSAAGSCCCSGGYPSDCRDPSAGSIARSIAVVEGGLGIAGTFGWGLGIVDIGGCRLSEYAVLGVDNERNWDWSFDIAGVEEARPLDRWFGMDVADSKSGNRHCPRRSLRERTEW